MHARAGGGHSAIWASPRSAEELQTLHNLVPLLVQLPANLARVRAERAKRLASSEARKEPSSILREFAEIDEPGDSIGDRAVRLGIYNDDSAVLVPLADFERALENEELLDDFLLEAIVAERLAKPPGRTYSVEEVARELGLAEELDLE